MAFDKQKRGNWIKASLSLLYLKEGISEELNNQALQFHNHIEQRVAASCKTAVTATRCTFCTSKSIKRSKKPTTAGSLWKIDCNNNVCNHWLDALIQFHEHMPGPKVEWTNCDPTLWPSQPWEIAKVFQPVGCKNRKNAEDTDVAGLLTLMLDCTYYHNILSNQQILRQIKDCRNKIMHSATLEVEDTDMKDWLDLMIALLEDIKYLGQLPSCKLAADRIRELRNQSVEVSFDKEDENTALSLQITTLSEEVSNIQRETDEMRCSVDDLTSKQQISSEDSELIHKELSTTASTVFQLKEQIETLQKTLCDSDIPQVKDKLVDLQQRLQSLSEQNKEDIRKLDARIGGIECKMDKVTSALSDVQYQLKSYEGRIGPLHKDTEEDVVGRVQGHLISLYNKNCQTVPLYPLKPEWREHVEGLFVTPTMVVINPRGIDIMHTTDRAGFVPRDNRESKVNDIRSIFYSGETLCTEICVVGDAGSGKSVLCEYLVHLWVKCHSPDVQNVDKVNIMENFTFLFYLSLRNARSCHVESMIREQLDIKYWDISKLLLDNTALVILDGLDEYTCSQTSISSRFGSQNIPERGHSAKSTYITTSRPWKMELLTTELEHKVDRQISIIGLEWNEQEKLVKKVLGFLNAEKGRSKSANDFFEDVNKKKLSKHMETPVLLMQMLGIWFSGEKFGRSQCDIYSKTVEMQLQFTEEIKRISEAHHTQHPTTHTKAQCQLPSCFKDLRFCQKYKSLLLKVSKLANQQLFSTNRESTLVFDHDQMEISGMNETEMKRCLQLGLLTQFKVIGEITKRLKSVSFVHKSHQEFFAAIYLSQLAHSSDLKHIFEGFSDLDRALEIEKVFTFACGMNSKVSFKIAKAIMQRVKEDQRVQQYRGSCLYSRAPNEELVKRIQGVILAGIEEGEKNDVKVPAFQLQDLWMKNEDRDFPPSRIFPSIKALDCSHVKSVFIHTPVGISRDDIWQFVKASVPLPNLQRLVLYDCDISVERVKKVIRRNHGDLMALGLFYIGLEYIDFSRLSHKNLQHILAAPKRCLGLGQVILTHEQMGFVGRKLSTGSYTELYLAYLKCKEHEYDGECLSLDLSAMGELRGLELSKLPLQSFRFRPKHLLDCIIAFLPESVTADAIRCLGQAKKLKELACFGYRMLALNELVKTLPRLHNLGNIFIIDADLRQHEQLLSTPDLKVLERISLYGVTLTGEHLIRILASVPSHSVQVELGNSRWGPVTITKYDTDVLKQLRDNPDIDVREDDVDVKDGECIVKKFNCYTKK